MRLTVARVAAAALIAVALGAIAAGCGSSGTSSAAQAPSTQQKPADSTPQASGGGTETTGAPSDQLHCIDAPAALAKRILGGVVLDGAQLRNVEAVASATAPGVYYVSSHVTGGGAGSDALATWATTGLDGHGRVFVVDAFAALISKYGNASQIDTDITIKANAAYRSRICAGGPRASHGAPAPLSGIGNPATG